MTERYSYLCRVYICQSKTKNHILQRIIFENSRTLQWEYICGNKLWANSRRLRQGKRFRNKNEEDFIRYFESGLLGHND